MGSSAESYASTQLLATILFLFFVSVIPGSPSRITTHSACEWATLISTILPTRAGFHAVTTLAKSPGLHLSLLAPVSRSTLAPASLPTILYVCTVVCQVNEELSTSRPVSLNGVTQARGRI